MPAVHRSGAWKTIDTAGEPALDARVRSGIASPAQLRTQVLEPLLASASPPDARDGELILALALLWHDHLPEAHALVQEREGDADADLLHALLHRREGDYGNAKYWFAAVGEHPCFAALAAEAKARALPVLTPRGAWSPALMVDAVSRACGQTHVDQGLMALQRLEFTVLCAHLTAG
jgi:hypothetical protein